VAAATLGTIQPRHGAANHTASRQFTPLAPGFLGLPRDGVDNLWITENAREATRAPQSVLLHPPQLAHGRHNSPIPGTVISEVQPRPVQLQPNGSSFFLPEHIAGKPAHFLLDSGCTTNILSRQFFDTFGAAIKKRLAPYEGGHGILADGLCIPFCGIIELAERVRNQNIQETFIVRQLNEDAILGMPFSQRYGCHMDFGKSVMVMGNKELTCVEKLGCSLAGGIQVVQNCTIPGRSRATVHCKVDGGYFSGLGVVESTHGRIWAAHSLNRLTERREIWVQRINPFPESVNLPSGFTLGQFYSVQEEDSGPSWQTTTESPRQRPSAGQKTISHHAGTREGHCAKGVGNGERQGKAKLLHRYSETPHKRDHGGSLNRAARVRYPWWRRLSPCRKPPGKRVEIPRSLSRTNRTLRKLSRTGTKVDSSRRLVCPRR